MFNTSSTRGPYGPIEHAGCRSGTGAPLVPFRAHATFATSKVAGGTSPAQMTLPETTRTGSGDGCQRTSNLRSRVSDRLQNDAPERRPSPPWPQRRTARRACSRAASTPDAWQVWLRREPVRGHPK